MALARPKDVGDFDLMCIQTIYFLWGYDPGNVSVSSYPHMGQFLEDGENSHFVSWPDQQIIRWIPNYPIFSRNGTPATCMLCADCVWQRRLQRLCYADQLVGPVGHHCTCANNLGLLPIQVSLTTHLHFRLTIPKIVGVACQIVWIVKLVNIGLSL